MTKETYTLLENYMLSCMEDSAHDKEHIYRVLYTALDIAGTMPCPGRSGEGLSFPGRTWFPGGLRGPCEGMHCVPPL